MKNRANAFFIHAFSPWRKYLLCCCLVIARHFILPAQFRTQADPFTKVDAYARSVSSDTSLTALTAKLCAPFPDTIQKLRAIFIWITDKIAYDYILINSGDDRWSRFACIGSKQDCDELRIKWENDMVQHVLQSRLAQCNGYASLFKKMCDLSGIDNEVVTGYIKKDPSHIGVPLAVTHAWNRIKIDGEDYFFDPTWAAGDCDKDHVTGKLASFVKRYKNIYWMSPPGRFYRNHYPKDSVRGSEPSEAVKVFFDAPFFYSGEATEEMISAYPTDGVIKCNVGDTVRFQFACSYKIKEARIISGALTVADFVPRRISSNPAKVYRFSYIITNPNTGYLDIWFNRKPAIRYKISPK